MVVPNGWAVKPLLECCDLLQGLTYSPSNIQPYGLLVLRSSNIQDGRLVFDDCVYVNCNIDENKYVKPNDILICVRNGSSALIGKSCVIDKVYNATFGAFMSVLRGDTTGYLAHMFASDVVQQQIRNRSSATINQITKRDFEDIKIPIPCDEEEQRAIAAALSDVDTYIAALEKLIAKKRAIKQGAMQELLTGKRRLPGFEGEWVEKPLDKIMRIRKERMISQEFNNARCIELEHIESATGHLLGWVDSRNQRSLKAVFDSGDVLFGKLRPYLRKHYFPNFNGVCSTEFWVLTSFDETIDNHYIYFLVQTYQFLELANSTTGTKMPRADWSLMKEAVFSVPSEKNEQTAIAEILSDMDTEIDLLTSKLEKARCIKQGMMSELLTGRIRLVEQEAPVKPVVAPKVVELPKQEAKGHNQQFDDAVMIAGIVNALYSDKYPLGRKKVQKCLYLLRRHQDESTDAFKKKAAGPYADEVRYKGGEPIARSANYIVTTAAKDKGTTFAPGKYISQALGYIESWGKQDDIKWVADKLKFKKVDELELLATVDMAICDLEEAGTPVSVAAIKHLIATNAEWKAKLKRQIFSDANIARAIRELQTLLQGGN